MADLLRSSAKKRGVRLEGPIQTRENQHGSKRDVGAKRTNTSSLRASPGAQGVGTEEGDDVAKGHGGEKLTNFVQICSIGGVTNLKEKGGGRQGHRSIQEVPRTLSGTKKPGAVFPMKRKKIGN